MRVCFLGTGGYHPNERRHTACVLLPELGLAFDAGTSFFRVPGRLETDEVQVFLSHAHLDHVVGLTYLLVPMFDGRVKRARLCGKPETLDAVRQHLFHERLFPVVPEYEFEELTPGPVTLADGRGTICHTPLRHPGGSTGFRLDLPDRSLAYWTDTTVDLEDAAFLKGVDLLIHECYFPDGKDQLAEQTGHSCTTPVAQLARAAGVGRLLLTHIDPYRLDDDPIGIEAARAVFPQTEVAEDLMEVDF